MAVKIENMAPSKPAGRRDIRVITWPTPWYSGIALFIDIKDGNGDHFYIDHDFNVVYREPATEASRCLVLRMNEAQELIDSMWAAGLRPTEGKGSAGQIGAVKDHLEDMRKIAFKFLGLVR